MAAVEVRDTAPIEETPRLTYLNNGHSVKSWLLTFDHKRIGILYLERLACGHGRLYRRVLLHFDWVEFYCHHSHDARARHALVPAAALHLGALCDRVDSGARHASDRDYPSADDPRTWITSWHF